MNTRTFSPRALLCLGALAVFLSGPSLLSAADPLGDFVQIVGLVEAGDDDAVVGACTAYLEAHQESAATPAVLFYLGRTYQSQKKYGDAIATLGAFLKDNADSPFATAAAMQRGEAYRLTNKPGESIPDFRMAYEGYHKAGDATAAHAQYHIVQAHHALGESAPAEAELASLQKHYPTSSYTRNAASLLGKKPAAATAATASKPKPSGPAVGSDAPEIEFTRIPDDSAAKLSDFRGKVVVVDFWASWCGPCQAPMAKMQTYRDTHPDWGDSVELIALSIDKTSKAAADHLAGKGWDKTLNAWAGDGGFRAPAPVAYGVRGIPTAYVIDQSGKVAATGHPASLDIPGIVSGLLGKK